MTTFSVVVPTYNGARFVTETVRSVVEQTRPADQIVVVDDGSDDGSADRVRAAFPEVTVIETPNRGRSAARNLGLALARHDWVCFLDHDDLWHREKLATVERYLEDHPGCRAVRHPVWYFAEAEGTRPNFGFQTDFVAADLDDCHRMASAQPAPVNDFSYLETGDRDLELSFERCIGFTSATVVHRELAIQAGGFPVYASGGEDWLFFLQVARLATWHTLSEPLAFARFHPLQGTNDSLAAQGVLAVKVAAWFSGRPFPERQDPLTTRRQLTGYGPSYANEVHDHLKAAIRARDARSTITILQLGALLLPQWRDRGRALMPARLRSVADRWMRASSS